MKKAAFPGSFDPPTFGHLDIIERASAIFDRLLVVVALNHEKNNVFSGGERVKLLEKLVKKFDNVTVALCPESMLLVDFLRRSKIDVLVRGLRNTVEFTKEVELAAINKLLSTGHGAANKNDAKRGTGIETIFLPSKPEFTVVSSSAVRVIAAYSGDVSPFIPPAVAAEMQKKFNTEKNNKHENTTTI
jgi:pantetheine-phosphate adenylyltransferase